MTKYDLSHIKNAPKVGINLPEEEIQKAVMAVAEKDKATSISYDFKVAATYTDFLLLTGLQKQVMKIILDSYSVLGLASEEPCPVDTLELKDKLGKSANQIGNTLYRLQAKGFFVILSSVKNGGRIVSVPSSVFPKKH